MPKDSANNLDTGYENKEVEVSKEGRITIKYDCFRKMISHILRFANESEEISQQALGICVGEYLSEDKSFIINDAIPITHGDIVELGFSQEIHDTIETIKSQYSETNNKIIGWYHSHLGYGLYFSNSDKANNQYFQNDDNPYGFGIVIEQTLISEDQNFGTEIFRLKDFIKGSESDYVKVQFEIESPNTLKYFKWVKELIESAQKKNTAIIHEVDELVKPSPEVLQEIPTSPQDEPESTEKEGFSILYGVKDGIEKFKDAFLSVYEQELNIWMNDVSEDVLKGSEYIRSSINNIKETLASGLVDVQRIFNRSFTDISNLFMKNIKTSVDTRLTNQIELKNEIESNFEEQLSYLFENLEKEIRDITNLIEEKITTIKNELDKITQNNNVIEQSLNQNNELLNKVYQESDKLSNTIIQHIENSTKAFELKLFNEIEDFSSKMNPNKETYREIEDLIERLQKVISSLRQVK